MTLKCNNIQIVQAMVTIIPFFVGLQPTATYLQQTQKLGNDLHAVYIKRLDFQRAAIDDVKQQKHDQ